MQTSVPKILRTAIILGVSGLVASTSAYAEQSFDRREVKLGPTRTGPVTILAAGDIASCREDSKMRRWSGRVRRFFGDTSTAVPRPIGADMTAALIEKNPDATVLVLGDLAYRSGTAFEFEKCFDPSWGKFRDRTYPTPGNHEYRTSRASGYYDYWGKQAGPDRQGYYSAKLGDWLLLSLNSETDASDGSPQGVWLQRMLRENVDRCVLAIFHKPSNSTVSRGGTVSKDLLRLLRDGGADVVLNGHNHFFERIADPSSTLETFVVGTGGRGHGRDNSYGQTQDEERRFAGLGALRMVLSADGYTWSFVSTSAEKVGSGRGTCS